MKLIRCSSNTILYCSPFIILPFGRKKSPPRPAAEKEPQTMMLSECFTVGAVYFGLHGDDFCGRRTNWVLFESWQNMLSSENITLLHCSGVHSLYFWQNASLFCRITAVTNGFFSGLRTIILNSRVSRVRIVLGSTLSRTPGNESLISADVMLGIC